MMSKNNSLMINKKTYIKNQINNKSIFKNDFETKNKIYTKN